MTMKIYLTNLGKYNEGELIGKWFELPIYDIDEALLEIDVESGTQYEEFFITDYEHDYDFKISVGEYDDIDRLNDIAEHLDRVTADEIYNEILEENGYDGMFSMEDFDYILDGDTPLEVAQKVFFGDFNPNHDYFEFDGYGNLKSYDDCEYNKQMIETIESGLDEYLERNV